MSETLSFPGLGLNFSLNRVAFYLGNFPVYWYGIVIGGGFLLAMIYLFFRSKSFGVDQNRMIDVVLVGSIFGVIGARLYFVLFDWDAFSGDLMSIFAVRDGGLAIYGGIIGGMISGIIMCRIRKVKVLPMVDLSVGGFLIGQGIGRWGNFFNIEAFGSNTTLPWGMTSEKITQYLSGAKVQASLKELGVAVDPQMPVHPTFLYESLWCLIGFGLVVWLTSRRRFDGELLLFYCAWYGAGRFVIEGLRTDSLVFHAFGQVWRSSQLLALLTVVVAVTVWVTIRIMMKKGTAPKWVTLFSQTEDAQKIRDGVYYLDEKQSADPENKEIKQTEDK